MPEKELELWLEEYYWLEQEKENQKEEQRRMRARKAKLRRWHRAHQLRLFMLTVSVLVVIFFSVFYIRQKNRIHIQNKEIEALESRLSTLKRENDALLENINNSIDWGEVKEVAIEKYGMHYPDQKDIVFFETDEHGYMRNICAEEYVGP